jgi:transglutaminase-like putative cysteine protease
MSYEEFLSPGRYIDSDSPEIIAFAGAATAGLADIRARVIALYRAVRDGIIYDPYVDLTGPANYRASHVLAIGRGFCVGKAALLAAAARVIGVPSRVGFADVRNHLTSARIRERIKTDVFIWHSYTDLYLDGRWAKATPAFDKPLCERLGLKTLEFDGSEDSLFQPFDHSGRRHMEYLRDRGTFADVPVERIQADFRRDYPMWMTEAGLKGDFHAEAEAAERLFR